MPKRVRRFAAWKTAGAPDPDFDDAVRTAHHAALTDPALLERYRERYPRAPDTGYDAIVRQLDHVWDCPVDGAANVVGFCCATCGRTRADATAAASEAATRRA